MCQLGSLDTVFLDKPPCCIAFSPDWPELFVVGTYDLELPDDFSSKDAGSDTATDRPASQARSGSLYLCELNEDKITILDCRPTPSGILDVHFLPDSTVAAATSTGSIGNYFFYFGNGSSNPPTRFGNWEPLQIHDKNQIITSFSNDATRGLAICDTLSTGQVLFYSIDVGPNRAFFAPLFTHSLEAWTAVFTPREWTSEGVLSGSDDAVLRFSSSAEWPALGAPPPKSDEAKEFPSWTDRKIHGAGVTAILPLCDGVVATGSYDDHLRILQLPGPQGGRAQVLHETNLGGGVWRLRLVDERGSHGAAEGDDYRVRLAVSCMYAGACIVDVHKRSSKWDSTTMAWFREHESMAYACEVQPAGDNAKDQRSAQNTFRQRSYVSCSFYDKRLCLWRF